MNDKEKELLAEFHHTISEQLNSRLSESPKFFALLVVVSTGYGYVLSNSELSRFMTQATLLALAATLWAAWYLAALGYAFRFLQYSQRHIEHGLEWTKYNPESGEPPKSLWNPVNWFWLLPGIYYAHAVGLCFFFVLICFVGFSGCERWAISAVGLCSIAGVNWYYFYKFKKKWKRQSWLV